MVELILTCEINVILTVEVNISNVLQNCKGSYYIDISFQFRVDIISKLVNLRIFNGETPLTNVEGWHETCIGL